MNRKMMVLCGLLAIFALIWIPSMSMASGMLTDIPPGGDRLARVERMVANLQARVILLGKELEENREKWRIAQDIYMGLSLLVVLLSVGSIAGIIYVTFSKKRMKRSPVTPAEEF